MVEGEDAAAGAVAAGGAEGGRGPHPLAGLRAVLLLAEGVVVRVVVLRQLVAQHVKGLAVTGGRGVGWGGWA